MQYSTNAMFHFPNIISRSSLICDGIQNNSPALGLICGRPLGLGFYYLRNELYIADAYRGLLKVRVDDRLALPVSTDHGEGAPYKLLDGLDVDQMTGDVYFTDASARFDLRCYSQNDIE